MPWLTRHLALPADQGFASNDMGIRGESVYSNSGSSVRSAGGMEAQRPAVARWIARNIQALGRGPITPRR